MQTKFILPCLLSTLFFLNSFSPSAQNRKTIETTTDILMFITPVAGFAGSLAIGDYQGTKQIIFSGAMNMAMTYALKYVIRKERPDHSDHHAFPSSHTSVSFQGASFIQRRYGWKFGLPAYLLSAYGGWGRADGKCFLGDGRMPKNTIGGISSEEQPSEQPAAISSPVRLPENTTLLFHR